ncbi:hypothetical protein O181_104780 [Austropuccinia psidii MF-1]|uniref:Uncharacterized protein n=1 Tax=Austropuccinia psidii MF-1 TaxID=1389203 RepID=A0A9Q3JKI8_9BASI|nr:hypothetical protein [Austropuccinia psidii MF-1]
MAFLGHLAPPRLLRPVGRNSQSIGQLGPFWPTPMRRKGGNHLAPKARWVLNHNWADLSQFWPPIPCTQFWPKNHLDTKMAIEAIGPIFGHGPPWTILPDATRPAQKAFPST